MQPLMTLVNKIASNPKIKDAKIARAGFGGKNL
jgi:hypothetical protein